MGPASIDSDEVDRMSFVHGSMDGISNILTATIWSLRVNTLQTQFLAPLAREGAVTLHMGFATRSTRDGFGDISCRARWRLAAVAGLRSWHPTGLLFSPEDCYPS